MAQQAYTASLSALINSVAEPHQVQNDGQAVGVHDAIEAPPQAGPILPVQEVVVVVPRSRLLAITGRVFRAIGRNLANAAIHLAKIVTNTIAGQKRAAPSKDDTIDVIINDFVNVDNLHISPATALSPVTDVEDENADNDENNVVEGAMNDDNDNPPVAPNVGANNAAGAMNVDEVQDHPIVPHVGANNAAGAMNEDPQHQIPFPNAFDISNPEHMAILHQHSSRRIDDIVSLVRRESTDSEADSILEVVKVMRYFAANPDITFKEVEVMMNILSESNSFCRALTYEAVYTACRRKNTVFGNRIIGGYQIVSIFANTAARTLQSHAAVAGAVAGSDAGSDAGTVTGAGAGIPLANQGDGAGIEFADLGMRHLIVVCIYSEKITIGSTQVYVNGLLKRIKELSDANVTYIILVDGSLLKEDFVKIQKAATECPFPVRIIAVSFSCKQAKRDGYEHAHIELMMSASRILPFLFSGYLTATILDTDDKGVYPVDQKLYQILRGMRESGADSFHNLAAVLLNFSKPAGQAVSHYDLNRYHMQPNGSPIKVCMGRLILTGRPVPHDVIDHIIRHSCLCTSGKDCPIDGCQSRFSIEQNDYVKGRNGKKGEVIEGEFGTVRINQQRTRWQYGSDEKLSEFIVRHMLKMGYSIIIVTLDAYLNNTPLVEHHGNTEHKEDELEVIRRALNQLL